MFRYVGHLNYMHTTYSSLLFLGKNTDAPKMLRGKESAYGYWYVIHPPTHHTTVIYRSYLQEQDYIQPLEFPLQSE